MDWIIDKSKKLTTHTKLNEVLRPLDEHIESYNWILSDIEGGDYLENLPIDFEQEYFILPADEFRKILNSYFQFYWGVVIAVPKNIEIKINEDDLPYSEGNRLIWENGHLQYPDAEIEIDCFDSSYTIVKFTREELSNKFKAYFDEALTLDKFRSK